MSIKIATSSALERQVDPRCTVANLCALEQRCHGRDVGIFTVAALEELVKGAECPPIEVKVNVSCAETCPGKSDSRYSKQPSDFPTEVTVVQKPRAAHWTQGLQF